MRVSFTATRTLAGLGWFSIRHVLDGIEGDEFTTGAAPGGDQFIALYMQHRLPEAKHRLVLPREQLSTASHHAFAAEYTDRFEVVRTELDPLARNAVILNYGPDRLYAFPLQAETRRSGTWATVRLARHRGIPVVEHLVGRPEVKS